MEAALLGLVTLITAPQSSTTGQRGSSASIHTGATCACLQFHGGSVSGKGVYKELLDQCQTPLLLVLREHFSDFFLRCPAGG